MWNVDSEFPALIQSSDGDATVLGNDADELLPNVLDVVVLSQLANVHLDCVLGWLTTVCVRQYRTDTLLRFVPKLRFLHLYLIGDFEERT